jgi:hypothetical protein
MGFGALILIFLFGFALFGVSGFSGGRSSATTTGIATAAAAGYLVTQADTGRSFTISPGDSVTVRLPHGWREPTATGPVDVQPVSYLRDPGFQEWTIVPGKAGTATVTAAGPAGKRFKLTVRVR